MREKLKNIDETKNYYENENEIKKCEIFINDKKIDFNYEYTFPKKGDYEIVYKFPTFLNSTNFMFHKCKDLKTIDLSRLKTQNVKNMSSMFSICEKLTYLNLSNINIRRVVNMSSLFNECILLKELDLSSFDTRNVRDMSEMFNRCKSLNNAWNV